MRSNLWKFEALLGLHGSARNQGCVWGERVRVRLQATVQELEASVREHRSANDTLQAQLQTLTQAQTAEKSELERVLQQHERLTKVRTLAVGVLNDLGT